MDTDEQNTQKPKTAKKMSSKRLVLTVAVALLAAVGGRFIASALLSDTGSGTASEQVKNFFSDDSLKEYVSADHNFAIDFPGFPAIEKKTLPVEGFDVEYTTYLRETNSQTDAYLVAVIDYSTLPLTPEELSLEGALNGAVQNTPSGMLLSAENTTLAGLTAIRGEFTTVLEDEEFEGYTYVAQDGYLFYTITTIGASEADFEKVTSSFRLTN